MKKEGILELLRNSIDGYKGVNGSISEKSCEELLESIFCIFVFRHILIVVILLTLQKY